MKLTSSRVYSAIVGAICITLTFIVYCLIAYHVDLNSSYKNKKLFYREVQKPHLPRIKLEKNNSVWQPLKQLIIKLISRYTIQKIENIGIEEQTTNTSFNNVENTLYQFSLIDGSELITPVKNTESKNLRNIFNFYDTPSKLAKSLDYSKENTLSGISNLSINSDHNSADKNCSQAVFLHGESVHKNKRNYFYTSTPNVATNLTANAKNLTEKLKYNSKIRPRQNKDILTLKIQISDQKSKLDCSSLINKQKNGNRIFSSSKRKSGSQDTYKNATLKKKKLEIGEKAKNDSNKNRINRNLFHSIRMETEASELALSDENYNQNFGISDVFLTEEQHKSSDAFNLSEIPKKCNSYSESVDRLFSHYEKPIKMINGNQFSGCLLNKSQSKEYTTINVDAKNKISKSLNFMGKIPEICNTNQDDEHKTLKLRRDIFKKDKEIDILKKKENDLSTQIKNLTSENEQYRNEVCIAKNEKQSFIKKILLLNNELSELKEFNNQSEVTCERLNNSLNMQKTDLGKTFTKYQKIREDLNLLLKEIIRNCDEKTLSIKEKYGSLLIESKNASNLEIINQKALSLANDGFLHLEYALKELKKIEFPNF